MVKQITAFQTTDGKTFSKEEDAKQCTDQCKYEPESPAIKYSGYALFLLALIFIAWQNT